MTDTLMIDRPISGDVDRGYKRTIEQKSATELLVVLDALLAVDGIEAVRWQQYTPYFNDGDTCEFSIYEPRVKLSEEFGPIDEDSSDYGDDYLTTYNLYSYGDVGPKPPYSRWNDSAGRQLSEEWSNKFYADSNRVQALNGKDTTEVSAALDAINLDQFENVLKANFGDHAEVTFTKDGFDVESYEHD